MVGSKACCSFLLLALVWNLALAQDRGRSRYIAPSQDEVGEPESIRPQEPHRGRRLPARKTRPTIVPTEESPSYEENTPRRLSGPIQPHLEDPHEVLHSQFNPTTQPATENYSQTSELPPVVPTERRKRPKKRRRPKTQPKTETSFIETTDEPNDKMPSDLTATHSSKQDLNHNVEPTTTTSPLHRKRQPQRQAPSIVETLNDPVKTGIKREVLKLPSQSHDNTEGRSLRTPNTDPAEPSKTISNRNRSSHRMRNQYRHDSSDETKMQNNENSFQDQDFPPQFGVDRLPVEIPEDHLSSIDLNKHRSNLPTNPAKESQSLSRYPKETSSKDHYVGYASFDDRSKSLQSNQENRNENRVSHWAPKITESNIPVAPANRPFTETISDADVRQQPKQVLEPTKIDHNEHDGKPIIKYSVPSNRLPNSSPVTYNPQDAIAEVSKVARTNTDSEISDNSRGKHSARTTSGKLLSDSPSRSLTPEKENLNLARNSRLENRQRHNPPEASVELRTVPRSQRQLNNSVSNNGRSSKAERHTSGQASGSVEPRRQRSRSRQRPQNSATPPDINEHTQELVAHKKDNNASLRSSSRYRLENPIHNARIPQAASSEDKNPPKLASQQRSGSSEDRSRSRHQVIPVTDILSSQSSREHGRRTLQPSHGDLESDASSRREEIDDSPESSATPSSVEDRSRPRPRAISVADIIGSQNNRDHGRRTPQLSRSELESGAPSRGDELHDTPESSTTPSRAPNRRRSRNRAIPVANIVKAQTNLDHGQRTPQPSASELESDTLTGIDKLVDIPESSTTPSGSVENQSDDVPLQEEQKRPSSHSRALHHSRVQHVTTEQFSETPRPTQSTFAPRSPERQHEPSPEDLQPEEVESDTTRRPANRRRTSPPHTRSQVRDPNPLDSEKPASNSSFQCPRPYGFYPHETQCDKYYDCDLGYPVEGLCSDGLAFSLTRARFSLRCDSIRDVDCSSRPQLQPPQPTKNCPRRYGIYPAKNDCTKFWTCVDGVSTKVECPAGLVFDDTKATCNWADLVKNSCESEDLLDFECPEAAGLKEGVYLRYPHPDNCQLHYTCIRGADGHSRPRMSSCREGLVYNPRTTKCTRPANVPGCEDFYGKPTPSTENPTPEPDVEEVEPPPVPRNQRRRRPAGQRS